jgi:hypothetical protein
MNAVERSDLAYVEMIWQHFRETPDENNENFRKR